MPATECFFGQAQSALVERLGLRIAALLPVETCQTAEDPDVQRVHLGVPLRPLHDAKRAQVDFLRLRMLGLVLVGGRQGVKHSGNFRVLWAQGGS